MSAVAPTAPPRAGEQHILLEGVNWAIYVALRDLPANRGKRMTYDQGVLEIMTLSSFHERIAQLIARCIEEWTLQRDIPITSCGSMTFQNKALERGLEPDKCYYIQHEALIRNQQQIDLMIAPPPDLAIEVDYQSGSLNKMPIYAAMEVPQVWRWYEDTLQVYVLAEGEYLACDDSSWLSQTLTFGT
jgi:Uma2 family endonuclease